MRVSSTVETIDSRQQAPKGTGLTRQDSFDPPPPDDDMLRDKEGKGDVSGERRLSRVKIILSIVSI